MFFVVLCWKEIEMKEELLLYRLVQIHDFVVLFFCHDQLYLVIGWIYIIRKGFTCAIELVV